MVAYELRKHVENAIYRLGRPTRWPMRQFLNGFLMVNIFDDSKSEIPTEGGHMAIFRHGSLGSIASNGAIKLATQGARAGDAIEPGE
jgi:hypothetical protein